MKRDELGREIHAGAARYAGLVDQASRTSWRAHLLFLIEQVDLAKGETLVTRRVSDRDLRLDSALRGAVVIHLDLVFRSSVIAEEAIQTAERGVVMVAYHPALEGFPIGVLLAQSTERLVQKRAELFDPNGPRFGESSVIMPYALATNPPRLGAGAKLLREFVAGCRELPTPPRIVAFSPLTGLRARVIRLVDQGWQELSEELASDERTPDPSLLREQLLDLLAAGTLPEVVPEPARSWIMGEARRFADSEEYGVGNFHRAMGASMTGLVDRADPADSDAMWVRAYFDYRRPVPEAT